MLRACTRPTREPRRDTPRRRHPFHLLAPALAALLLACGNPSSDAGNSRGTGGGGTGGSSSSTGGYAGQATGGSAGDGGTTAGTGGSGPDSGTTDSDSGTDAGLSDGSDTDADGMDGSGGPDADTSGTDAGTGTLQIMPLGDSITYGSGGTNAGYRGPLYNLLKTSPIKTLYVGSSVGGAGLPSNQQHNEGHASYTINDISNNLDGLDTTEFDKYGGASRDPHGGHWFDGIASGVNARPALYPDIILMMVGTNNAYASDSDRTAVRNQLHALITKITTQRPNAKLVVAQITPSNRPYNVSYNADVVSEVKIFQAAGKQVSTVDMYTGFPSDGLSGDGVHPNDTGYAFMAKQWHGGLAAVVPGL